MIGKEDFDCKQDQDRLVLAFGEWLDKPRWVIVRKQGDRKRPFQVDGSDAKSNDPSTWATYRDALGARQPGEVLGIMLAPDDELVCFDFDNAVTDGKIHTPLANVLRDLPSFAERSVSGNGLHIFARCGDDLSELLGDNPQPQFLIEGADKVEIFRAPHLVAVTGWHPGEAYERNEDLNRIRDISASVRAFVKKLIDAQPSKAKPAKPKANESVESDGDEPGGAPPRKADSDVVERCRKYLSKLPKAISGKGGHDATLLAACTCFRFGLDRDTAAVLLAEWNDTHCTPKWSDKELAHKLDSAEKKVRADGEFGKFLEKPEPSPVEGQSPYRGAARFTDAANGFYLATQMRGEVRWCKKLRQFYVFDAPTWREDTTHRVEASAKSWIRQRVGEILKEDSSPQAMNFLKRSLGRSGIRDAVELLKSEPGISIDPSEFDTDPHLLGVSNGVLDLRTLTLRDGTPADLITRRCNAAFDPEASSPRWTALLERVLPDPEVRDFVQRVFGYALTGEVSEHLLVFPYGTGRNGKSTVVNAFLYVMGDYAWAAPPSMFAQSKNGPRNCETAELRGRRFVATTEVEQGCYLAESHVKSLTGGDFVTADAKFKDPVTFKQQYLLVMSGNHRPRIRGNDEGIWRRIALVPFLVKIPTEEQDGNLPEKLRAEADGILRWAVDGLAEYQRRGLDVPPAVLAATGAYRADEDLIGAFLDECCEMGQGGDASLSELFGEYTNWAQRLGIHAMGRKTFSEAIETAGFVKQKTRTGVVFSGVRVRPLFDDLSDLLG